MEIRPHAAWFGFAKKVAFYLLLVLVLSPLIVLFEYAQSRYRVHVAEAILADIQTLSIGTSSFADAAAVVARHPSYLLPQKGCSTDDCEWSMRLENGPFIGVFQRVCAGSSDGGGNPILCESLWRVVDSEALNSLGIRQSGVYGGIRVRANTVQDASAAVMTEGPSHKWLCASWHYLPNSPQPGMPSSDTVLYDHLNGQQKFAVWWSHLHMGWEAGECISWLVTTATPEDNRREAFHLNMRCLDGLSGCIELREISPDGMRYLHSGGAEVMFLRVPNGPISNKTILYTGIAALVLGVGLAWLGNKQRSRSRGQAFVLVALSSTLAVVGATSIYMAEVAEQPSLWYWPAAALLCFALVRYGPDSPRSIRWRVALFGAMSIVLALLVGRLNENRDLAAAFLVSLVFISWASVAKCRPASRTAAWTRRVAFVGMAMFAASLWLVTWTRVPRAEAEHFMVLTVPFGREVRIPHRYDWVVGDGFKVILLVSVAIVALCSVAYLWKWHIGSRRTGGLPQPETCE